jgi:hypothetical protein
MSDEKKIIIDEDWKSQVEAEKEAERKAREQAQNRSVAGETASAGGPSAAHAQAIPASFELLVTTFVTEAMVALGQLPHPVTGKQEFDPAHARFAIDMLEVIADKTKGNLTPAEERALQDVLHQLRMAFVATSSQQSATVENAASSSPSSG